MPLEDALEWCDQNMHNNYPIVASASAQSQSGIYLPPSFLVDAQIVVPRISENTSTSFYISSIFNIGDALIVSIGYRSANGNIVCAASGAIDLDIRNTLPLSSRTIAIAPTETLPDNDVGHNLAKLSGYLVIGTCQDMQDMGTLTFEPAATELIGVRVYVVEQENTALSVMLDSGVVRSLSGDIVLKAGDGIDFDVNVDAGIVLVKRVDTENEANSNLRNVADVVAAVKSELGIPIRIINGIAPTTNGEFYIQGGDCVAISTDTAGISVSNSCARPCCGTSSTEDLNALMSVLESAHARLTEYYENISTNVNAIQARLSSLIASRR